MAAVETSVDHDQPAVWPNLVTAVRLAAAAAARARLFPGEA